MKPLILRSTRVMHRCGCVAIAWVGLLCGGASGAQSLLAQVGTQVVSGPIGPQQAADSTLYGGFASSASYGFLVSNAVVGIAENGSENGLTTLAEFRDTLTVAAAGATTPSGFLTARFRLLGSPEIEQTASSGAVAQGANTGYLVLRLQGAGSFNVIDGRRLYNSSTVPPGSTVGSIPAPGLLDVDFPFFFDSASEIGLRLQVDAAGSNLFSPPEEGTLSARSEITLVWDEIVSIRDGNGNELLGTASVTSGSGTDYTVSQAPTAVPVGPWVAAALVFVASACSFMRNRAEPDVARSDLGRAGRTIRGHRRWVRADRARAVHPASRQA